ncbi:AAA family ATPase [Chloroflexota bacterium]
MKGAVIMTDQESISFITSELAPDLLITQFGVQTNWHVITGAPCCGKTTLIDLLAEKGSRQFQKPLDCIWRMRWLKGERSMKFAQMRKPWNMV